eukprot:433299_1
MSKSKRAKMKVINATKDNKYVEMFDAFRKNPRPYINADGPYKNLKATKTNLSLFHWLEDTSHETQVNFMCAFVRGLRKGLNRKAYCGFTHKFKFKDLRMTNEHALGAAQIFPKASGLESNYTTWHQAMNRYHSTQKDIIRIANVGSLIKAKQYTWPGLQINHTMWFGLMREEAEILDICLRVRGAPEPKAESMPVKMMMCLFSFVVKLIGSMQDGSISGTSLLWILLVFTILFQPGRSAEEFIKRNWTNDVHFGHDLEGNYVYFREAMATKGLGTDVTKNRNRVKEKVYEREDQRGFYSVLKYYQSVRPNAAEVSESVAKRKEHVDVNKVYDGYFLQPRGLVQVREDGSKCLFNNMNMGSTNVNALWKGLLRAAEIDWYSLYSCRATCATMMAQVSGMDLFEIASKTGHSSQSITKYVRVELANEKKENECMMDDHQQNIFERLNTNIYGGITQNNGNPPRTLDQPRMLCTNPPRNNSNNLPSNQYVSLPMFVTDPLSLPIPIPPSDTHHPTVAYGATHYPTDSHHPTVAYGAPYPPRAQQRRPPIRIDGYDLHVTNNEDYPINPNYNFMH